MTTADPKTAESAASEEYNMKVGILGSGVVAQALGDGFVKHGHEVMLGTRDASKLANWAARNPSCCRLC